jgi:hypothetical protein
VPQNKPFPDMTLDEEQKILEAVFNVVDRVHTLHLSGGGEPFLHKDLPALIDAAFEYESRFERFMLFTNSTIPVSDDLLAALGRHKDKTLVHASDYGIHPERTAEIYKILNANGINTRVLKYYGEAQDFDGWVDFGDYKSRGRTKAELNTVFSNCAVTRDMHGNWRTRDGTLHWCSRSQRGLELGLLPMFNDDFVDLLDKNTTCEHKREQIRRIMGNQHLQACDWCSGDQGTGDHSKRYPAAVQL